MGHYHTITIKLQPPITHINVNFELKPSLEYKFLLSMQRLTRRQFFEEPYLYDIFMKVNNE